MMDLILHGIVVVMTIGVLVIELQTRRTLKKIEEVPRRVYGLDVRTGGRPYGSTHRRRWWPAKWCDVVKLVMAWCSCEAFILWYVEGVINVCRCGHPEDEHVDRVRWCMGDVCISIQFPKV